MTMCVQLFDLTKSHVTEIVNVWRHNQLPLLSLNSWFCPGVRVHKGITIVLSLFRSHWLAVVYCLVLCSGSCEPVKGVSF